MNPILMAYALLAMAIISEVIGSDFFGKVGRFYQAIAFTGGGGFIFVGILFIVSSD